MRLDERVIVNQSGRPSQRSILWLRNLEAEETIGKNLR